MRCKVHNYSIYSIYSPKIIASLQGVSKELSGNDIFVQFRPETTELINMQMRKEYELELSLMHHLGILFSDMYT